MIDRRGFLSRLLFGAGGLGLRALATGLPISFWLDPRRARAQTSCGQYLIVSTSADGDALNANVPGTYGDAGIGHPQAAAMAPTALQLGNVATRAAAPWALLPQWALNQTCFFHHATSTVMHSDEPHVLRVGGAVSGGEMLVSLLSAQLSNCLNTVQSQPIVLGPEPIWFQGAPLPSLRPSVLAATLTAPGGALGQLSKLREQTLDALSTLARRQGNATQQSFIDAYASSHSQIRQLSQSLLAQLAAIADDGPASQLQAAQILIQMKVAPVIVVHLPFGGDNHLDLGLANEATQTVGTLQTLSTFLGGLRTAGLQQQVSLAMFNVFGRTLAAATSAGGRGHNGAHACAVLIGSGFAGSVIGGVQAGGGDYQALPIDSTTGAGSASGDISPAQSLAAMALTLGVGVGADPTFLQQNLAGGTVVKAALATGS